MRQVAYVLAADTGEATWSAVAAIARAAGDLQFIDLAGSAMPAAYALNTSAAIWIHLEDPHSSLDAGLIDALGPWIHSGGRALLTMAATRLSMALGVEQEEMHLDVGVWSAAGDPLWAESFREWPDYPHIRGVQGWGPHPLFQGLMQGTFSWAPQEGEPIARYTFTKPRWPSGRIVGVDRAYVQLDASTAVAWEYEVGHGRVLCLGANVPLEFASARLEVQRHRLLINALRYVAGRETPAPTEYWPDGNTHASVRPLAMPRPLRSSRWEDVLVLSPIDGSVDHRGPERDESAAHVRLSSIPAIVISRPDLSPVVHSAGGVLMTGNELHGLSEVWLRALCVLDGGLAITVAGVPLVARSLTVGVHRVERRLRRSDGGPGEWLERWSASPDDAVCTFELRSVEESEDSPRLEFVMPLRLQWPVPPQTLAPLRVEGRRSGECARVRVMGCDGQHGAEMRVDGVSDVQWHDHETHPRIEMIARNSVQIVWSEVSQAVAIEQSDASQRLPPAPSVPATPAMRAAHAPDALAIQDAHLARVASLGERRAILRTGTAADVAWEWATYHLSSLMAPLPFGGRGLLAGIAGSRPGWGISRPGYAWMFGRDTCWCIDAMLVAGLHEEVADCLRGLAATRDITGKIAHEVTLSGVVHYDAADASPLFLRALAAYWEWTGDLATIRDLWPATCEVIAFIGSCDRDDDGLPENTSTGHGWVESGPLGGGHVTSYVATIWIDALRRLEPVAEAVGDAATARNLAQTRARALNGLASLRDPESGRLALHRTDRGALLSTSTAMSAVPVALGLEEPRAADAIVGELSSDRFTAPWGVRMLSRNDPSYNPRGYHSGAVWPLYTGWLALACAERWRPNLAAAHIDANANLVQHRAKGAFDEVLDGDTGAAAGVCPQQAWSAAMNISPVGLGLLGLRPVATSRSLVMRAQLPDAWPTLRLDRLRVGGARLDIHLDRQPDGGVQLTLRSSEPMEVTVEREKAPDLHLALDGRGAARTAHVSAGGQHGKR